MSAYYLHTFLRLHDTSCSFHIVAAPEKSNRAKLQLGLSDGDVVIEYHRANPAAGVEAACAKEFAPHVPNQAMKHSKELWQQAGGPANDAFGDGVLGGAIIEPRE
ncbi:MAG: hypothetical protein HXX15_19955 [Rhodopseudomonas sp.]|uniref:hypothetical protein n=1 Tax=Rhodopseudomonas sp. TaxID=1078 RepID=UPI0017C62EDA|nr:hypothetical protein [Rhodopseudomonas sp.]NVN88360.1 hypothetical protein [Rhodopseudomonas sp.]